MDPNEPQAPPAGYQLGRELARDAWGALYEAVDLERAQKVALRIFTARMPAAAAQALRGRAAAAAALGHPNIVPVHDWRWDGDSGHVAMAWVEGERLDAMLSRVGRLPAFQALAFAAQLLSALEHAHRRGVVHCALDLDQLLVSRNGQLMVAGFATAAWGAADTGDGEPGRVSFCRAPEQIVGQEADHRTDLYAAAAIAYQLLAGTSPLRAHDPQAADPLGARVAWPARAARPDLPAGLDPVFQRALAQDRDRRYQSPGDLLADLLAACGAPLWDRTSVPAEPARTVTGPPPHGRSVAVPAPRSRPIGGGPWSWRPNRRAGMVWGAACAATIVLAAAWMAVPTAPRVAPAAIAGAQALPAREEPVGQAQKMPAQPQLVTVLAPPATQERLREPPAIPARQADRVSGPEPRSGQPPPDARPSQAKAEAAAVHRASARQQAGSTPGARANRTAPQARRTAAPQRAADPAVALDCQHDVAIARDVCAAFRCATAAFRKHPVCVRMHAEAYARHRLDEQPDGP
jgi:hypothetical protein